MPNFSFSCATHIAAKRARTAAQQHSSTAALPHGLTAALPHGLTASRPHGRTSAWRHGGTAHHRMAAPLQPAYTRSLRTPAAGPHRGPLLRLSLRRRSLRGEARRGRGRRSQHRADRGATGARCSDGSGLGATTAERIARPMCPRSRGEIARSRRAERLAQVAHCPRGNSLPGEIALSVRKGSRSGSAQAGQARPWQ